MSLTDTLAGAGAGLPHLAQLHPADAVEALNGMSARAGADALSALPFAAALAILNQAGLDHPAALFEAMPQALSAPLLAAMAADRRVAILRALPAGSRAVCSASLSAADRTGLDALLAWPADTAGSIMTTEFVRLRSDATVAEALDRIRKIGREMETIYAIYLVDPASQKLQRAISLRDVIVSAADVRLGAIGGGRAPIIVAPGDNHRDVARIISKYDLLAVPVVDAGGNILGIVTVDDVIDAMVEENTSDVQKLGGMEALGQPYMLMGFAAMLRKRAGWLLVLFLSEMLTASAMQYFQSELEKAVVLTLFIPLIMSSGGNSGSQATSLIIRALALHEIQLGDWWRIARRELPSGLVLGAILGVVGIIRITLWQKFGIFDYGPHWVLVAATVGAALVGIVTFGSLAGSMLPFILQRLSFDPASASAPFVATLVDVSGLVIYFTIALAILRGTLL